MRTPLLQLTHSSSVNGVSTAMHWPRIHREKLILFMRQIARKCYYQVLTNSFLMNPVLKVLTHINQWEHPMIFLPRFGEVLPRCGWPHLPHRGLWIQFGRARAQGTFSSSLWTRGYRGGQAPETQTIFSQQFPQKILWRIMSVLKGHQKWWHYNFCFSHNENYSCFVSPKTGKKQLDTFFSTLRLLSLNCLLPILPPFISYPLHYICLCFANHRPILTNSVFRSVLKTCIPSSQIYIKEFTYIITIPLLSL